MCFLQERVKALLQETHVRSPFMCPYVSGVKEEVHRRPLERGVENMQIEHTGLARRFTVTFGLKAGYGDNAKVFPQSDAEKAIQGWMANRIESGKKYLTGSVRGGTLLWGWKPDDAAPVLGTEAQAEYSGVLHPLFNADLTEEEVLEMLQDLASKVGNTLEQERVWVEWGGKVYVLKLK